ncbi:MAG: hypothetical protein AMXMBFR75_23230 [Candidatus Hinthialibacteria bacterium]
MGSWLILGSILLGATLGESSIINEVFPQDVRTAYYLGSEIPGHLGNELGAVMDIDLVRLDQNEIPWIRLRTDQEKAAWMVFRDEAWQRQDPPGDVSSLDKPDPSEIKSEPPAATPLDIMSWARKPGGDLVAFGTAQGLFIKDESSGLFSHAYPADDSYSWAPKEVAALVLDRRGNLWFGSREGVGTLQNNEWKLFTGAEGLPYGHFTCACLGVNGEVWFGTIRGAMRYEGDRWRYRASERWLPDDHVNSIVVDSSGTAWIATPKGVSRIERQQYSFEKKAAFFLDQVEARHNRDGYVTDCALRKKGDVSSWYPKITDNDGGYTALHGAAMAFRFAVTRDPADKALAQRCFLACKRLVDIVPESMRGFPARVLIPVDWPEPVNEIYGDRYNQESRKSDPFWKLITPRFVKSEDGKYYWKCDTSSDELAAHYFFYAIYYDLVAQTEEEKSPAREVIREITDHLIRNGFNLIDHDGEPTRWGRFGPDYLLAIDGWEQRGLNSLMILSFLAVAEHVTGDPKYAAVAAELRVKYHYHINTLVPRITFPPDMIASWDNDLGLESYYTLMLYEKDPELLLLYRQSLEHFWLYVSKQKNPFWSLAYAACAKHFIDLDAQGHFDNAFEENPDIRESMLRKYRPLEYAHADVIDTLRVLPLDMIAWEANNSHRYDIQLDPSPGVQPGIGWSRVDGKSLPIDERGHVRQDRDGFALDALEGPEGSGLSEHEGTFYLLPYYLGRYHGFIE